MCSTKHAERFVAAAKATVLMPGADTARRLLAADLALLATLEAQVADAAQPACVLPATPSHILTTTPGWALDGPAA